MNKQSEYNELRQRLASVTLPTIDVSSTVMEQIRAKANEYKVPVAARCSMHRRPKVIWITAAVLFFTLTVTVSAAVLPLSWNGGRITIEDDGGRSAAIDAFKELIFGEEPTYKETIEDVLNYHKNAKEIISMDEAQQQFPFTILRPDPSKAKPIRSNGALMNQYIQENGKDRIIGYKPYFHDIYELDHKRWIIVTQSLNEEATDFIQGRASSISATYIGNWENVQINEQVMAMYKGSKKQNRLLIQYKNEQSQVINLEIVGTGTNEQLIKLAEAYVRL
jgi:hypothetical protein